MSHNSILHSICRALLVAVVATAATSPALAQGITVNTKDGRSIAYPAGQFSSMTPYILSLSSSTYTQGVVATLDYEKAADMSTGRADHQTFASGSALVVVGGHTSNHVPTASAELWQDGRWKTVSISNSHDTGFSVVLADGRVMVGGGYSGQGTSGGSTATDIFNPATQTFSKGPSMTTPRSNCKAVATTTGVFVHGNRGGTDAAYDFYNGASFAGTGNPDGRYRPYLFADSRGNIYALSTTDNQQNKIALRKSGSGVECLYGEKYDPTANEDYYYFYNGYTAYMPLTLPADIRSEQYNRRDRNGFMVLTRNAAGDYLLTEPCADESTTYNYTKFDIPSRHPVSNELIEWRGGVYVNNDKDEAYLIGSSQSGGKYTLHIISLNYKDNNWTIASAGGFAYDLATASFTLLADGRLACSGGYAGTTAQKSVYLFTLPVAGLKTVASEKSYGIDINKPDGTSDRYMESDLKSVTTYRPDEKPDGHQQSVVVPYSGGQVSLDDLTLKLPAGTFNTDSKVTITEAEKGYVDGDDELSPYYKVHFTTGVRKDFKVSVTMPRLPNDADVKMQFAVMGWAPSIGTEAMTSCYMDVTYVDGAYVAEIPEMEDPDETNGVDVWFSITKSNPVESAAARALASNGTPDFKLYNKAGNANHANEKVAAIESALAESVNKLQGLGYEKPEKCTINCYLIKEPGKLIEFLGGGNADGWCSFSYWGKKYATVYLNNQKFANPISSSNKATIIHELFHFYQQFYDTRCAARYKQEAKSTPLILEEASSTWSERFYDDIQEGKPKIIGNVRDNISLMIPSIDPDHKDVVAPSNGDGLSWSERFANVGYGSAALIEYLTQKCGDKILLEMWKERQTGDPFDTKGYIERQANKHSVDIFSQEGYKEFVEAVGSKNVYRDINFSDIVKVREEHDSIGVLVREVKDAFPNYHTNYVYGYGALVEELTVPLRQGREKTVWAKNATGIIEQTEPGFTTWVYKNFEKKPVGSTRKGNPLKIEPGVIPNSGTTPSISFYLVTIADDFKTKNERISRIASRIFLLDMPEKKLMLPSSPGSEKVRLETNCYNLKFKTNADWIDCYQSVTDSTLRVVHEAMPENLEQRKAIIQIIMPKDDGSDFVLDEVEVTQTQAYINLSTTDVDVKKEGETKTVSITSTNCNDLQVGTTSLFLHPTLSGSTITVKVDPNTSFERREGSVKVSGKMPETGVKVERYISFSQEAAPSPDEVNLFDNGYIIVNGTKLDIPGKTLKYGDYLRYRSADTKISTYREGRQEESWDVELYLDPKDGKSLFHYEFYSGSVTYQRNRNWTEKDKDGKEIAHSTTERCSYNLKSPGKWPASNYILYDGICFDNTKIGSDYKLNDYLSDYSYVYIEDGKVVQNRTQKDIQNSSFPYISLTLAEGVPFLEANRDSVNFKYGAEEMEYLTYHNNNYVHDVEITTSDDWMTIERLYTNENNGSFNLYVTVNRSKATRKGYVYITGTLNDGSKLTQTIAVEQVYDPVWDDDETETTEQKPELPSQKVIDALQKAGMPLYIGYTPPPLNGTYMMKPLATVYQSEDEDDDDNDRISGLVFNFTTTGSNAGQAMMSYYAEGFGGANTAADEYYCYYGGYGNSFTLSNVTTVTWKGVYTFSMVTVVSGVIEDGNIRNLRYGSVDLDEDGEIETISVGADGDGISTPTKWEPGEPVDWSRSLQTFRPGSRRALPKRKR